MDKNDLKLYAMLVKRANELYDEILQLSENINIGTQFTEVDELNVVYFDKGTRIRKNVKKMNLINVDTIRHVIVETMETRRASCAKELESMFDRDTVAYVRDIIDN